ncbi:cellulase Cel48A precursor [Piromyces finnis]|uniref:Cellulase Cel48A n=1 Tax=Piromyces finnis TaxID=1754191 RepID=A0A1Y1VIQ5_9FUNG|nr:cellulase Cel48A precursor [Piromyces finnis]ORX57294.1 cellulase Cel48A precursor [Piromyces finnis]ORX57295.1 cellulase Cel48A precursor [Piromyces finnis]|eukprot:ORX57290.1 cellulase Cel48A precursor [Piromyces finnis]
MPSIRSAIALLGASAVMAAPMKRSGASQKFAERAMDHYNIITGNGSYQSEYFSPENVPYHSIETLMVEAPDHGHESVSETYSFWVWLEAVNGKLTGDYSGVETAWSYLEKHLIPDSKNQPGMSKYNTSSPATYAPESDDIEDYPAKLEFVNGVVGEDPIAKELSQAYGNWDIYAMHWIIDGDNWYGYGQQGDGKSKPSFINTFQRGASESAWKTVPHPCWETMKWGGKNGFLDLFTLDNSYAKQWRYTAAPDADARAIQAAYFGWLWADEDGQDLSSVAKKASKLGDYLRYAHYDKYFKKIGNCVGYDRCSAGSGKNSAHYLISWYFAWGGGLQGDWSWRIGSSHTHSGYQSPLAAWILSTQSAFKPKSATGAKDWATSMDRQLELFRWLQTPEGCIAGGATNSWQGHYAQPSSDITSFYGMWYDWQPVYHDPPSNNWTGMQGWGMERVCSMYYLSGDERAGLVCQNWAKWVKDNVQISGNEVIHATNLAWSGNPDEWKSSNFNKSNLNRSLHGTVSATGIDLGTLASIMKALMWVSMKDGDDEGLSLAVNVMEVLENYKDDLGYATYEERLDYANFGQETYIPSGWSGKNAQGANIKSGATFIDIRPKYKEDPDWAQVEDFLNGGNPPAFTYHRFWGQTEIMVANGLIAIYDLGSYSNGGSSSGNNNSNTGSSGKCSASIMSQGYKCCSKNCQVVYTDADGDWGVENGQWCGCGGASTPAAKCNANVIAQGYKCCSSCSDVWYTDADGDWGVENGNWCGMPSNC